MLTAHLVEPVSDVGALAERLARCNAGGGRDVGGAFSLDGANAWQAARDARFTTLNPSNAIERLYGLDPTTATWIEESRTTRAPRATSPDG